MLVCLPKTHDCSNKKINCQQAGEGSVRAGKSRIHRKRKRVGRGVMRTGGEEDARSQSPSQTQNNKERKKYTEIEKGKIVEIIGRLDNLGKVG